jgi:AcrR family transcriptional regulator
MTAPTAAARAGRPRSVAVTTRVQRAARRAFSARGFGNVTMADVAAEAGVGLDSIYRRWPSQQALLVDLVAEAVSTDVRVPDTGSLHEDLVELVRALARVADGELGRLLGTAIAEGLHDPLLARRLAEAQATRRRATVVVVDRAIQRGEVSRAVDAELLLDAAAGLVWQRVWIAHASLDDDQLHAAIAAIVRGFSR